MRKMWGENVLYINASATGFLKLTSSKAPDSLKKMFVSGKS